MPGEVEVLSKLEIIYKGLGTPPISTPGVKALATQGRWQMPTVHAQVTAGPGH